MVLSILDVPWLSWYLVGTSRKPNGGRRPFWGGSEARYRLGSKDRRWSSPSWFDSNPAHLPTVLGWCGT